MRMQIMRQKMGGVEDRKDLNRLEANGTEGNLTGPKGNDGNHWNLDQK